MVSMVSKITKEGGKNPLPKFIVSDLGVVVNDPSP